MASVVVRHRGEQAWCCAVLQLGSDGVTQQSLGHTARAAHTPSTEMTVAETWASMNTTAQQQEEVVDEGKRKYLRKKRRQAQCGKIVRWIAAFVAVACTTAFLTLILANHLCERFAMAISCENELQPRARLPALASAVGVILFVFWALDVCWAGIVRRKLLALSDKEANDLKKKQQMYAELGITEAEHGGDSDEPAKLSPRQRVKQKLTGGA